MDICIDVFIYLQYVVHVDSCLAISHEISVHIFFKSITSVLLSDDFYCEQMTAFINFNTFLHMSKHYLLVLAP